MAENYSVAFNSVLAALRSMCRNEDSEKKSKCQREIYERMLFDEVARCTDVTIQQWKQSELDNMKACYKDCQVRSKSEVKECNTRCLNPLVQSLWQKINVKEYESIASKYL